MFNKSSIVYFSLVTALLLGGCGSSDDSDESSTTSEVLKSAYLSDSRIAGITYTCASETGITDREGKFSYSTECNEVSFSIGGINLGTLLVSEINEDSVFYPADLLGLDRNNTSNPQLSNMLQFLQSLDNDANPNNGINITPSTSSNLENTTLDLDNNTTSISDITSILNGINIQLINRDYAIAHYEDTLRTDLNISVDTVAPAPAIIVFSPSETYSDTTEVTINGEVGAKVFVNNLDFNITIDSNNSATIVLNTADNTDVNNTSTIVLMDDANRSSDAVTTSILRASQATLDIREVSAIKTTLEASTQPRSFTYTQMWNSGEDYNISFSPIPALTVENQDYNATATITKGLATDTLSIPESLTFSQDLRDATEIASLKQSISTATLPRSFTYTQEWPTGSDYNVTFSLETKAPTVETQTYDVVATLTKGSTTDSVTFSETVPFSQALRDAFEVSSIRTSLSTSTTPRTYTYIKRWATGDNFSISFDESLKIPTIETQSYPVTISINQGKANDTIFYTEVIPFDQLLRDRTEVASIKSRLISRDFTYTQQWATGNPYNIVFSEQARSATTETQSYPVTVTIVKGTVTDSLVFSETIPFSQNLRDEVEVTAIKTQIESMSDYRSIVSYTQQWTSGTPFTIAYSETKRIPTAIDQEYQVTISINKGSATDSITFTELVPTTNVNIVLGDGTTTLINDEYRDAFTVTNGGLFQKIGDESSFIGAAVSIDASQLNNITSSNTLLSYIITNSALSGLNSISLNNSSDGSLVARYEINALDTNLYELLEGLLSSLNYSIDNIDFSLYNDVNNTIVDFYVEYDATNASYVIVSLSDKSIEVDSDITKIINKDSIVEAGETIVNEQSTFGITNVINKGDFLFVMDDSGSMSSEQTASIEAISRTFSLAVAKYNLDWKATVIGTSYNNRYTNLTSDPSENNVTKLTTQLDLGTNGSGTETGLKRAYIALSEGAVVERNNSSLSVIYISDEVEHSSLSDFNETDADFSNSYFALNGIKYNVIIPTSYTTDNDYATKMYLATQGSRANLTNYESGYDQMMDNIVKYAVAKSSSVKLNYPALASSITVHVNGVKTTSWEYDPSESAIVFDALNMPDIGDEVTVTYSHLDYADMITSAISDFENLSDSDKRAYTNTALDITFDPSEPLAPLTNTDQSYDVTVSFSKAGYIDSSRFQETVVQADVYASSSTNWSQSSNTFTSTSITAGETTILEITALNDTIITSSFNDNTYDRLTIRRNGTQLAYYNDTSKNINTTIPVSVDDVIIFEYYKYYDSSTIDGNVTVTLYDQSDFEDIVTNAKAEFDLLSNDTKRSYTNSLVNVTFSPVNPATPLTDADQIYDVTVTFDAFGYTQTSSFQETVLMFDYATINTNSNWLQTNASFESQNHNNSTISTLELTMAKDSTIDYVVSSEGGYDKLRVTVNGTEIGDYGNTSGSFDVLTNDLVKLEYHKDGSTSTGTDNAIVTFH